MSARQLMPAVAVCFLGGSAFAGGLLVNHAAFGKAIAGGGVVAVVAFCLAMLLLYARRLVVK